MKALGGRASRRPPSGIDRGRRRAVGALLAGGWSAVGVQRVAHAGHGALGPVSPARPVPGLALTLHDGRRTTLSDLLAGRIGCRAARPRPWSRRGHRRFTALQLMFTGCSATCPIQGAVFAALQAQVLGRNPQAQLLSLSIDPLGDDARALAAWRRRFAARPEWVAAVPSLQHADVMLEFLRGRASAADRHTPQVYLMDPQGRLAYRCAELASADDLARLFGQLASAPSTRPARHG